MRVLYVNHTAQISGGEQSLLALLAGLPPEVEPLLACPDGELSVRARTARVEVSAIPPAEGSLKLHPVQTATGTTALARAAAGIRGVISATEPDVVHANSIRAGMAASIAARLGGPPFVVSVRDCLPEGRTTSMSLRLIGARAAVVIGNSQYTAEAFARSDNRPHIAVAYSPVDLDRFDPEKVDRAPARRRLGLSDDKAVLTVLAQITPWKGQDDAVRVLGELRRRGRDVCLMLVGSAKFVAKSTRLDNVAFVRELKELGRREGVESDIAFLGERDDVREILRASDLVLVPSSEEPFGRAVVEAMAMEVPVLATNVGGPPEIISDGVDGLLLPPRSPMRWADAAAQLLDSPEKRREISRRGRATARERFGVAEHVRSILELYEHVLDPSRDGSRAAA